MKILDLTTGGRFSEEIIGLYNRLAVDIGREFTKTTEGIYKGYQKNIYWWINSSASRNTITSPFFRHCCNIALVQHLINQNTTIDKVVVDSKAFKKVLERYFYANNLSVAVEYAQPALNTRLKKRLQPFYIMLITPLKYFSLYIAALLTRSLKVSPPKEPLILIDTFLYFSSTNERHYCRITDTLKREEKRRVFFIPTFYKPKKVIKFFRKVRKNGSHNYLFKEDYLKLRDYLPGWHFFKFFVKPKIAPCYFKGLDITPLVIEELSGFTDAVSGYVGILNLKFIKRLKESGIKIHTFVNWFENQVIDKGMNLGLNKYYPEVNSIGYQGFITTSHYHCMFPTSFEREQLLLPKTVAVIGTGLVKPTQKYYPELRVILSPAFRFQDVWEKRRRSLDKGSFIVLVALPIMVDVGDEMLRFVESYLQQCSHSNIVFWIKQHPDNDSVRRTKNLAEYIVQKKVRIVDGDFDDLLERSSLLISSGSSSCMNALAKEVPVIVIGSQKGLTYNPIPLTVNKDIWRLCYNENELKKAIEYYKMRDKKEVRKHQKICEQLRTQYFKPVTRESVCSFLRLENF